MAENASIKVLQRSDYTDKNGNQALYLRVIIGRQKFQKGLNIKVPPECFDTRKFQVTPSDTFGISEKMASDYNLLVQKKISLAWEIVISHRLSHDGITMEQFKEHFDNPELRHDFYQFADQEIKKLSAVNRRSTVKTYEQTVSHLKSLKTVLMMSDLTLEFVHNWNYHLMTYCKLSKNTRLKHHKNFKMLVNQAVRQKLLSESPYKNFQVGRMTNSYHHLTAEEVSRLEKMYNQGSTSNENLHVLAYFLFACRTGLRISDIHQVSYDNISDGFLSYVPVKSTNKHRVVDVPISDRTISLAHNKRGKLFNPISDQKTNIALKRIAADAGISKRLTFHMARHTFGTGFVANDGSMDVLQQLMGHSKIETTLGYVTVTRERKRKHLKTIDGMYDVNDSNEKAPENRGPG